MGILVKGKIGKENFLIKIYRTHRQKQEQKDNKNRTGYNKWSNSMQG